MKLRVEQEDGEIILIELDSPNIHVGVELDRIVSQDGMEHFFTKDGYYDGWGKNQVEKLCRMSNRAGACRFHGVMGPHGRIVSN